MPLKCCCHGNIRPHNLNSTTSLNCQINLRRSPMIWKDYLKWSEAASYIVFQVGAGIKSAPPPPPPPHTHTCTKLISWVMVLYNSTKFHFIIINSCRVIGRGHSSPPPPRSRATLKKPRLRRVTCHTKMSVCYSTASPSPTAVHVQLCSFSMKYEGLSENQSSGKLNWHEWDFKQATFESC